MQVEVVTEYPSSSSFCSQLPEQEPMIEKSVSAFQWNVQYPKDLSVLGKDKKQNGEHQTCVQKKGIKPTGQLYE